MPIWKPARPLGAQEEIAHSCEESLQNDAGEWEGAACLCSASTEEEAGREAFTEATGISVRCLETLLGGGVPHVRALVSALQKLGDTAYPQILTRRSRLRCTSADMPTSRGPGYMRMACSADWHRVFNEELCTKTKAVLPNWEQLYLAVRGHWLEMFWVMFWSQLGDGATVI